MSTIYRQTFFEKKQYRIYNVILCIYDLPLENLLIIRNCGHILDVSFGF